MTRSPLLAAALFLSLMLHGCGDGADEAADDQPAVTTVGAASAQTATVGMNDQLKFVPTTVRARTGSVTLTVDNLGRVPHDLVFSDEGIGKTGTIGGMQKQLLKVTFTQAGSFTFVCTFHPRMTGKVVVS